MRSLANKFDDIADEEYAVEDARKLASCCGIVELSGLKRATPSEQVATMAALLADNNRNQLIFTDVISKRKDSMWSWTKARAFKGPESVNPATHNKVQVYIVTSDDVRAMAKELGY